jgi:hypothetical protein
MLREIFVFAVLLRSASCRLRQIPPCLEVEEVVRPFVKDFNFTLFAQGTWYDVYADDHPFNYNSKCVRTTFLQGNERLFLITNFVDPIGLLTRVYGVASENAEKKGYDVTYFAVRELRNMNKSRNKHLRGVFQLACR